MDLTIDALRFLHLLSVALGFGFSMALEIKMISNIHQRISQPAFEEICESHIHIENALVVLWFTGLSIALARYGHDLTSVSPKLVTKFIVISILTLNGAIIGSVVLNIMRRNVGRRLSDFPLSHRVPMFAAGAISSCSWMSALALGVFTQLKTMDGASLAMIFIPLYAAALAGGVLVAILLPSLVRMFESDMGDLRRPF